MVSDVRSWPLSPELLLCRGGGAGGVVGAPGSGGCLHGGGCPPEVPSDATLLDLERPSPGTLTCCVASGNVCLL